MIFIRRNLLFGIILLTLFLFSGCIDMQVVIKVRPDGSGEIHETLVLQEALVSMADALFAGDAQAGSVIPDESGLRSNALQYGSGVTLKEVKEIHTKEKRGYTAIYHFNRLEDIHLTINADEKFSPKLKKATGAVNYSRVAKPMSFGFTRGSVSQITVYNPFDSSSFSFPETDNPVVSSVYETAYDEAMLKNLAEMFGFTIEFALEPIGKVVQTNAAYRHGNKIALFTLNFGTLLKNSKTLNEVRAKKPGTFAELKKLVPNISGLEIPLEEKIIVQFK